MGYEQRSSVRICTALFGSSPEVKATVSASDVSQCSGKTQARKEKTTRRETRNWVQFSLVQFKLDWVGLGWVALGSIGSSRSDG